MGAAWAQDPDDEMPDLAVSLRRCVAWVRDRVILDPDPDDDA